MMRYLMAVLLMFSPAFAADYVITASKADGKGTAKAAALVGHVDFDAWATANASAVGSAPGGSLSDRAAKSAAVVAAGVKNLGVSPDGPMQAAAIQALEPMHGLVWSDATTDTCQNFNKCDNRLGQFKTDLGGGTKISLRAGDNVCHMKLKRGPMVYRIRISCGG